MENQKGWMIELLCFKGIAIIESNVESALNKSQSDDVKSIYKSIQKWTDINDDKVSQQSFLKQH